MEKCVLVNYCLSKKKKCSWGLNFSSVSGYSIASRIVKRFGKISENEIIRYATHSFRVLCARARTAGIQVRVLDACGWSDGRYGRLIIRKRNVCTWIVRLCVQSTSSSPAERSNCCDNTVASSRRLSRRTRSPNKTLPDKRPHFPYYTSCTRPVVQIF